MPGLIILPSGPVTQSPDAVKQLIAYHNHGQEPAEMPAFYRLTGDMVLVQNGKRDAYYVTTPKTCSCPSATYRPGSPCKHQRKYFPQPKAERPVSDSDSIAPTAKWAGGRNGPVDPDELKVVA
jgi:hypothetical protein